MSHSEVETPAAPEWLVKLEERRERKLKSKLGHESGAGAPCNECGDKCPGLDLHFWRKVCRNCKCRKDQHMCQDDDITGWAQFEILGQIRSKPAYIKIKALADQPVKLDWIPPNSDPDIISDYMNKLGSNKIPIAGSDAAAKRKQQLQFQVPAHDMDATLCDNLTDSETAQLEQYVKKIRENCVGQGNVVRIGEVKHAQVNHLNRQPEKNFNKKLEILRKINETPGDIVKDKTAMSLLNSEQLTNAILLNQPLPIRTHLIVHSDVMNPSVLPPHLEAKLTNSTKDKLKNIPVNIASAESITINGPFYEKILDILDKNNLDISKDPILQPIKDFIREYNSSPTFRNDIDQAIKSNKQYSTPIKGIKPAASDAFNSPVPLRYPAQTKFGTLIKQDTPMRKVKFGGVDIIHDLGLPADAKFERDKILLNIVNSEKLANILKPPHNKFECKPFAISDQTMFPNLDSDDLQYFSPKNQNKINEFGLNKDCLLSGFINGPHYDQIFGNLQNKGINVSGCRILHPLKMYRQELLNDNVFEKEIANFVENQPNNKFLAISNGVPYSNTIPAENYPQNPLLSGSKSSDSGFESKPPTPNQITNSDFNQFADASLGKFTSIPGIEDLNMYPTVHFSGNKSIHDLGEDFSQLGVVDPPPKENVEDIKAVPVLKCKDCQKFIMSGEVAVKAERAGKEIAWHPECFKCHSCKELLADLVYFFHSGNVYCGRDLALILKIPRCNACDELIFTKEYTAAENATFHIKHFCCYQCDIPLAGKQYIPDEKTNMPLCLNCYDQYYAERCKRCQNQIGPTEQGVKWGEIHWHGTCFMCAGINCGKSLIGGRFCVKQDMPFCSPACVKSVLN
ncbi:uncharacterized protein LOC129609596 [Condylostylus longicornis]|uniref:uncharacterized protein LOC129609596 n=1 Tax=Condylostylus longicornis TaxID=2530218 RepID=UPI00244DE239|nr:uncharacterized protein LOC129609596 [Condylostylus longicornis]